MQIFDAKTRALIQAGLVKPVDVLLTVLLATNATVTFFGWLFSPSFKSVHVLAAIGLAGVTLLIWTVLLGYRVCVMVLEARADINLMPENAARLARMFQPTSVSAGESGKKPAAKS